MLSSVGAITLFRQSGSAIPPWPAVVAPDDLAPQDFLDTRPLAYVHLILLAGGELKFRWAVTSELHNYDPSLPFTHGDTIRITPGLWNAYRMTAEAIESGLGFDYWRNLVRTEMRAPTADSMTLYADSERAPSEGFFDDYDLQMALEQSRLEFENANRTPFSTLSVTPPPSRRGAAKGVIIIDSDDDDEDDESDDDELQYPPSRLSDHSNSNFLMHPHRTINGSKMPVRDKPFQVSSHERPFTSSTMNQLNRDELAPSSSRPTRFLPPRTFADGLNLKRLDQRSAPKGDAIEGELEKSKTYVRIRVGPEQEELMLPKDSVFDRPYFRDSNAGIMYFTMNDDDILELKHPSLLEIDPEDFTYVAQYLESGQLGYINPHGEKQQDEAFQQVIAAWLVAQALGMTDLMDHLVDKLERLENWDLVHVIILAHAVYAEHGIPLPAQEAMRNLLAASIAEYFWIYIEDDHLNEGFARRLRELPELDRDVSVKRTALLDGRLAED